VGRPLAGATLRTRHGWVQGLPGPHRSWAFAQVSAVANQSLLETDVDREVPEHGLGAAGVRGVTGCAAIGGDGDPTATDADMHLGSRALLADPDVDSVAGCRYANRGACDCSRRALRRIGCSASSRLATSRICGGSVYARAQVGGVSVSYPIRW